MSEHNQSHYAQVVHQLSKNSFVLQHVIIAVFTRAVLIETHKTDEVLMRIFFLDAKIGKVLRRRIADVGLL
jgi:hypothetical protein